MEVKVAVGPRANAKGSEGRGKGRKDRTKVVPGAERKGVEGGEVTPRRSGHRIAEVGQETEPLELRSEAANTLDKVFILVVVAFISEYDHEGVQLWRVDHREKCADAARAGVEPRESEATEIGECQRAVRVVQSWAAVIEDELIEI